MRTQVGGAGSSGTRGAARAPRAIAIATILALVTIGGMVRAGAAGGTGCRLQATATFSPGLTLMPQDQTLRVLGTVSICSSAPAAGPATGTVSVGNVWTDPATGFKWQEPIGTANGFCGHTTTAATSITRFADGTVSAVGYQTVSAVSGVLLKGTVLDGVTLTAVEPQPGQAPSLTVPSTRNAGGAVVGTIVATSSGAANCAGSGLTSVTLDGLTITAVAP